MKPLQVDIERLGRYFDGPRRGRLNLKSGAIVDTYLDSEADCDAVQIPRVGASWKSSVMRQFASSCVDEKHRATLTQTLEGPQPEGWFLQTVYATRTLDLNWQRFASTARIETAREWLRGLGIEPVETTVRFEEAWCDGPIPFDLMSVLIYGAPDGKIEHIEGATFLALLAPSPATARTWYVAFARMLAEHYGIAFAPAQLSDTFECGRFTVEPRDRLVEIWVAASTIALENIHFAQ